MEYQWLAESLRFTVFLNNNPPNQDILISLEKITGKEPTVKHQTMKPFRLEEKYVLQDRQILLINGINRLDFFFFGRDQTGIPNPDLSQMVIGNLIEILPQFREMSVKLLSQLSQYKYGRVACGIKAIFFIENPDEGYKEIQKKIPVNLGDRPARDLFFRINFPVKIKVKELEIEVNQISQWSTVEYILDILQPDPQIAGYACRADLDINTSQNVRLDFSNMEITDLFDQLCNAGLDILSKGIK